MLIPPKSRPLEALFRRGKLCQHCYRHLTKAVVRQAHSSNVFAVPAASSHGLRCDGFANQYFSANVFRRANENRLAYDNGLHKWPSPQDVSTKNAQLDLMGRSASNSTSTLQHQSPPTHGPLPHRRRRRKKDLVERNEEPGETSSIPPDSAAELSARASALRSNSIQKQALALLALSKPRLTVLIVLTTASAYSLYPVAVSPLSFSLDLSPVTLLMLTTGTALASASANAFNMLLEPEHDAKMSRTRTRPLVRGLVSSRLALIFALAAGVAGTSALYFGVNPTTAALGAANIVLYAGVYTPLKRISVLNTWAGAIVGGIPPLMGWTAAAGQAALHTSAADPTWRDLLFAPDGSSAGGWLLAALLFAWQFPHFWALAYPIRQEYASAGYRMLVSTNVRKTGAIALRYSLAMFPICAGLSATGITTWTFVATSSVVNAWMAREAWRYWRLEGVKNSARGLFWASVWHLPLVLVLAMVQKKGLWERIVQGGFDEEELRVWQGDEQPESQARQQAGVEATS